VLECINFFTLLLDTITFIEHPYFITTDDHYLFTTKSEGIQDTICKYRQLRKTGQFTWQPITKF